MNGFSLARWFDSPHDASGPQDDAARERVLDDVMHATLVAVNGDEVLVRTPTGACHIEVVEQQGVDLVMFDHVEDGRWNRVRFWMNASSVVDVGRALRAAPRIDWMSIMTGEV
jgi:hypothetical protein